MTLYLFVLFSVLFIGWIEKGREIKAKMFLFFSFFGLIILNSFRSSYTGRDFYGYIIYFEKIREEGTAYFEEGYVWFNRIIGLISGSQIWLAFCVSSMLMIPLYKYLKKYVPYNYFWFCVFVLVANPYLYIQTTFNAMRQCCSIGIVLIAMMYYLNEKYIRAFMFFALSITFHRSSIFAIIILPICLIDWSHTKWIVLLIISLIVSYLFSGPLISYITKLTHYDSFSNYDSSLLNIPIYIVFIICYLIFLIHMYQYLYKDDDEKKFVDLYIASLCFLLFAVKNDAFYRVRIMLLFVSLPGIAIIFRNMPSYFEEKGKKNISKIIIFLHIGYYIAFYVGYLGLLAYRGDIYYIPFKFVFNQ